MYTGAWVSTEARVGSPRAGVPPVRVLGPERRSPEKQTSL